MTHIVSKYELRSFQKKTLPTWIKSVKNRIWHPICPKFHSGVTLEISAGPLWLLNDFLKELIHEFGSCSCYNSSVQSEVLRLTPQITRDSAMHFLGIPPKILREHWYFPTLSSPYVTIFAWRLWKFCIERHVFLNPPNFIELSLSFSLGFEPWIALRIPS